MNFSDSVLVQQSLVPAQLPCPWFSFKELCKQRIVLKHQLRLFALSDSVSFKLLKVLAGQYRFLCPGLIEQAAVAFQETIPSGDPTTRAATTLFRHLPRLRCSAATVSRTMPDPRAKISGVSSFTFDRREGYCVCARKGKGTFWIIRGSWAHGFSKELVS